MNTYRRATFLPICALFVVWGFLPVDVLARTLLEAGRGTTWKYLDDGSEPDESWRQIGYDDAKWKTGSAPLGFGETRLTTVVNSGPDKQRRPITTWFRREFAVPDLAAGESLVLLLCVDDGAVVYVNGREIARTNMPEGPVRADTLARETIGNNDEGFYTRIGIEPKVLRAGQKNVLAVEVHQASANSSDLFFDLALKVLPAIGDEAQSTAAAHSINELFNKQHMIGFGVKIPDGYIDGGRRMKIDDRQHATSGREILTIDRSRDAELAADLAFARSAEIKSLPTLERVQHLAARIDERTTPPGGLRWVGKSTEQLEKEFANKAVFIGDWVDQCQAGVCRHRALLFKILADEAGLRTALVRGNFSRNGPPGIPHVWNEVELDDGQRVLIDVMHNGGKAKFAPLSDPEVVARYLKVDGEPWYGAKGREIEK